MNKLSTVLLAVCLVGACFVAAAPGNEIEQLRTEIFDESSPLLSPDEILQRLTSLQALLGDTKSNLRDQVDSLVGLTIFDASDCTVEGMRPLVGFTRMNAISANVALYSKWRMLLYFSRCAAQVRETAAQLSPDVKRKALHLSESIAKTESKLPTYSMQDLRDGALSAEKGIVACLRELGGKSAGLREACVQFVATLEPKTDLFSHYRGSTGPMALVDEETLRITEAVERCSQAMKSPQLI